ncbi:MAG: glycosyltransferase family 39 protein [Myxococcales bacterium]|nr:glycosyltransferase family 39 protein [Myxococcales bacterium]
MSTARARAELVAPWLAVAALVAWSAWHRWQVLTASPHPVGIDGYFYAIQVRSLLERGGLAYPAAPLTFYLMAALAHVTDVITSVKLVAAIGGALAIAPAYAIGRRLGGVAGGLTAAVVIATSGGSFYLSLEFVKNGVGVTMALTAVWLGLRALAAPTRAAIALAVAAAIAAVATHKMAAALVAALLAPAIVVELHARWGPARARRAAAIVGGALALVAIALGALAPARFIAGRDLAELRAALGGDARWSLPAMYVPHPGGRDYVLALGDQTRIALALAVIAIGLAVGARFTARLAATARPADRAAAWSAIAVVLITAIPVLAIANPDGIGFRLRVAVFAPAAIVAAIVVGRALASLAPTLRLAVIAPMLLVRLWAVDAAPREGVVYAHPAMVAAMVAVPGRLPPDAVVITSERHLGFMIAWYARVPVRMRPEPVPPARRWRLLAGNLIGLGSPLDKALRAAHDRPGLVAPVGTHPRDPSGLVLVPDATWDWVLTQVPPKLAAHWRRWPTR